MNRPGKGNDRPIILMPVQMDIIARALSKVSRRDCKMPTFDGTQKKNRKKEKRHKKIRDDDDR